MSNKDKDDDIPHLEKVHLKSGKVVKDDDFPTFSQAKEMVIAVEKEQASEVLNKLKKKIKAGIKAGRRKICLESFNSHPTKKGTNFILEKFKGLLEPYGYKDYVKIEKGVGTELYIIVEIPK